MHFKAGDFQTGKMTCLHVAAATGRRHLVKFLISVGVDVNQKDVHGFTALQLAAINGHLGIIKASAFRLCMETRLAQSHAGGKEQ